MSLCPLQLPHGRCRRKWRILTELKINFIREAYINNLRLHPPPQSNDWKITECQVNDILKDCWTTRMLTLKRFTWCPNFMTMIMTSSSLVYILMHTSVYCEIQGVWKLSLQLPSCIRTLWKDADILLIATGLSHTYEGGGNPQLLLLPRLKTSGVISPVLHIFSWHAHRKFTFT